MQCAQRIERPSRLGVLARDELQSKAVVEIDAPFIAAISRDHLRRETGHIAREYGGVLRRRGGKVEFLRVRGCTSGEARDRTSDDPDGNVTAWSHLSHRFVELVCGSPAILP